MSSPLIPSSSGSANISSAFPHSSRAAAPRERPGPSSPTLSDGETRGEQARPYPCQVESPRLDLLIVRANYCSSSGSLQLPAGTIQHHGQQRYVPELGQRDPRLPPHPGRRCCGWPRCPGTWSPAATSPVSSSSAVESWVWSGGRINTGRNVLTGRRRLHGRKSISLPAAPTAEMETGVSRKPKGGVSGSAQPFPCPRLPLAKLLSPSKTSTREQPASWERVGEGAGGDGEATRSAQSHPAGTRWSHERATGLLPS